MPDKITSIAELKKWLSNERAQITSRIKHWTRQRLNARNNRVRQNCEKELIHFSAEQIVLDNFLGKINELEGSMREKLKDYNKEVAKWRKSGFGICPNEWDYIKELRRILGRDVKRRQQR